jgi:hypothetical protein
MAIRSKYVKFLAGGLCKLMDQDALGEGDDDRAIEKRCCLSNVFGEVQLQAVLVASSA